MDPQVSCGFLYLSFGLLTRFASMGMEAFSPPQKKQKKGATRPCQADLF